MTYREARTGAAIAGTILCALPLVDILHDPGRLGLLHFAIGVMGVVFFMFASLAGRWS